jgi:hypothetical protein
MLTATVVKVTNVINATQVFIWMLDVAIPVIKTAQTV